MGRLADSVWARVLLRLHRLLQRASGGRAGLYVYLLCAQPLLAGESAQPAQRPDNSTRIAPVGPHDPLLAHFSRPAAVLRARFADGARCYAATVKDRFAGHIWIATGYYDEDEVRCRYQLPPDVACVWDYDVYIDPAFRLTRVLSKLWQAVMLDLAAHGARWSFSRISLYSRRSVLSHERLGARKVGYAAFLVLGPLQLSLQSGRPRLYVGVGRGPTIAPAPPAS